MNFDRRLYSLPLIALAALCLNLVATGAHGESRSFRFPLWKDVPGRSFAVLAGGARNGTEWAVFASRAGTSARSKERPCITVARFTRDGRYSNAGSCGPLAPEKGLRYPPIHPLLGETGASYFAVSLSREVKKLEVELGSRKIIRRTPEMLNRHQARKAHLPRFGYIAVRLAEDVCISRLRGFNLEGQLILDSETYEC